MYKDYVNIYPYSVQANIYTIFMCMGKYLVNIINIICPYSQGGRNKCSYFDLNIRIVRVYAQELRSCKVFNKYHIVCPASFLKNVNYNPHKTQSKAWSMQKLKQPINSRGVQLSFKNILMLANKRGMGLL